MWRAVWRALSGQNDERSVTWMPAYLISSVWGWEDVMAQRDDVISWYVVYNMVFMTRGRVRLNALAFVYPGCTSRYLRLSELIVCIQIRVWRQGVELITAWNDDTWKSGVMTERSPGANRWKLWGWKRRITGCVWCMTSGHWGVLTQCSSACSRPCNKI